MLRPPHVLERSPRLSILVSVVVTLLASYSCNMFAEPQSWSFVESVGGIAVDPPVRADHTWVLPVRSDVSGLKSITTKPTIINSGMAPAQLGQIATGKYMVFYRGPKEQPVQLGEVVVGP